MNRKIFLNSLITGCIGIPFISITQLISSKKFTRKYIHAKSRDWLQYGINMNGFKNNNGTEDFFILEDEYGYFFNGKEIKKDIEAFCSEDKKFLVIRGEYV